jgi:hypothetical protein
MRVPERHLDIDRDMPVRDLLRLLDVPGDSVTMLFAAGEPVLVKVYMRATGSKELALEKRWERSQRAMEEFWTLVGLDELERRIYHDWENDPIKPPLNPPFQKPSSNTPLSMGFSPSRAPGRASLMEKP